MATREAALKDNKMALSNSFTNNDLKLTPPPDFQPIRWQNGWRLLLRSLWLMAETDGP